MEMSEIEREAILAQRQEEMQRFTDKLQLDLMVKQQSGRGGEESVSKAAKRAFFCMFRLRSYSDFCRATCRSGRHEGEE